MKNGGEEIKVCRKQVKNSIHAVCFFFPSVFMWSEVWLASDAVSDPLFVSFHPRGRKTHPTKDATIEDMDGEALKWFLSGAFNSILLWFNKSHLNHI